jgi:F-type H+-transporting ATPase subunit gamma
MGRYRKVELQLGQLGELKGIVASMKTLSQLELHKLGGLAGGQREMVGRLEQVAADFLAFHPRPDTGGSGNELWLLIGSERGFCGDFNAALLRRLLQESPQCADTPQRVVAVGRKLWLRMEETLPGFVPLSGASVSEELPQILTRVVAEIRHQLTSQQLGGLRLLYHGEAQGAIQSHRLLPPQFSGTGKEWSTAPLLQLAPAEFYLQFLQHYLYLALTELFTVSLLAENRQRVAHLEGAVRRLDERLEVLGSRARTLRQEEITEEIETILLGSDTLLPQQDGS